MQAKYTKMVQGISDEERIEVSIFKEQFLNEAKDIDPANVERFMADIEKSDEFRFEGNVIKTRAY